MDASLPWVITKRALLYILDEPADRMLCQNGGRVREGAGQEKADGRSALLRLTVEPVFQIFCPWLLLWSGLTTVSPVHT